MWLHDVIHIPLVYESLNIVEMLLIPMFSGISHPLVPDIIECFFLSMNQLPSES